MGPRLFSRGNVGLRQLTTLLTLLQWGHDFSAVEMAPAPVTIIAPDPASMGPRLFSRGNGEDVHSAILYGLLQWGHDFSAVEIPFQLQPVHSHRLASMGPRLFSRGNREKAEDIERRIAASMGPRLFSRGNLAWFRQYKDVPTVLQWGHDFSAVEMAAIFCPLWVSKNEPFSRGPATPVPSFSKCQRLHGSIRNTEAFRAPPGPPGTTCPLERSLIYYYLSA